MKNSVPAVHLPDFEGADSPVPAKIARRYEFLGDLARFASRTRSGPQRLTPIRCTQRADQKRCEGLLVVRRRDLPPAVEWYCPECWVCGRITGWEDTGADLREHRQDPDAETFAIPVSVAAHAALRDAARHEPSLSGITYTAEADEAGRVSLVVTLAESLDSAPVVLREALVATNERNGRLLAELAGALAMVGQMGHLDGAVRGATTRETAKATRNPLRAARGGPGRTVPSAASGARPRPRPARPTEPKTFQLKVTLRDVKPPVWRRLVVPSDIRLAVLHEVLQTAMGWQDSHLHAFRVGDHVFAPPGDFEPLGDDSREVALDAIAPGKGSRLVYEYDFGDGWCHDIVVEDVNDGRCAMVRCVKGRRRCPPEDCGGPFGYAELREAIAAPAHQRHDEVRDWLPADFDPDEFDVACVDALVRSIQV